MTFKSNPQFLSTLLLHLEDRLEGFMQETLKPQAVAKAPKRKTDTKRKKKTVGINFKRVDVQEPLFTPGGDRNTVLASSLKDRDRTMGSITKAKIRVGDSGFYTRGLSSGSAVAASGFALQARIPKQSRASSAVRRSLGAKFGGLSEGGASQIRLTFNTGQQGGRLKKSAQVYIEGQGEKLIGRLVFETPYAMYVEKGTQQHGAAQPYLVPTLEENREVITSGKFLKG